jgi:hypothetical protein
MSASAKKRADWSAWRVSEDEVRVQINRPDMARAFAKVKSAWLAGYSVAGNYMKLFHVKQPVPWVEAWMKEFNGRADAGATVRRECR